MNPGRGEVWMVECDPIRGHEQGGRRPAVVVSVEMFNSGPAELVIVMPMTSKAKGVRSHVRVEPPEGGVTVVSYVKCEDIRSVAKGRLSRVCGRIGEKTMAEVEHRVRMLLGL
jgi:mRNA interferase MazF